MQVRELIKYLSTYPQEMEVVLQSDFTEPYLHIREVYWDEETDILYPVLDDEDVVYPRNLPIRNALMLC